MVDFINQERNFAAGTGDLESRPPAAPQSAPAGLEHVIRQAGGQRFRPIVLTSVTTLAGLAPMMADRSMQAAFLIPMAVSLAFGVLFATVITLFLVPIAYAILDDLQRLPRLVSASLGAAPRLSRRVSGA